MTPKKGLGKGLSALFSIYDEDTEEAVSEKKPEKEIVKEKIEVIRKMDDGKEVQEIDISTISPNPNQPRKSFDQNLLMELADSIKVHGVIQPIILNKENDKLIIIAGERRWRAAKIAGLKTIPAIINSYTERQVKEIAIIENLQREDLNPIEAARAIKQLMEEYNFTQENISERIGVARATIANILRLLTLYPDIVEMIEKGRLSAGHGKCLASISSSADQLKFANLSCDNKVSVRELEKLIKDYLNPKPKKSTTKDEQSLELKDIIARMQGVFMTKVSAIGNDNKGRIYLDYFTKDDLDRIVEILDMIEAKKLTLKNLSDFNKRNND